LWNVIHIFNTISVQGIKTQTFAHPKEPHAQEAGTAVCCPHDNHGKYKKRRWGEDGDAAAGTKPKMNHRHPTVCFASYRRRVQKIVD
jgi:hypothetical protein